MPPNMISGPKPHEYHFLQTADQWILTLSFSPEAFLQKSDTCVGRYQIRLTLWQGNHLLFSGERQLVFYASRTGIPDPSNLYTWPLPIETPSTPLTWLLECHDTELHQTWVDSDTLRPGSFKPLFLSCEGKLCSFSEILSYTRIILTSPAPIVEVVLYQAESKLPGVQRYLSLQERRFLRVRTAQLDTLSLDWRKEELNAGEYLTGIYAYRGKAVVGEAFHRVTMRVSSGRRAS